MIKPADIAVADYPIAEKPAFGGEHEVFLSHKNIFEPGSLEITAANTGTWTPSSLEATKLAADPRELALMVDTSKLDGGASPVVVSVTGTDQSDNPISGTATFAPPGYAVDNSNYFTRGFSAQVITAPADSVFKTITAVTVSCAADAVGSRIAVFAVPALSTFAKVGCVTDKDFTTKNRRAAAIQCGMDESAFTKPGVLQQGSLNITAKTTSYADNLFRFNGVNGTGLVKVNKEGSLITDHLLFVEFNGALEARPGSEGEDQAVATMAGLYQDLIILSAP